MRETIVHSAALLRAYLQPHWRGMLLLTGLLFGSVALQLLAPLVLRACIDAATRGAPQQQLVGTALLFLAAALLQQVLAVAAPYVGQDVAWRATNALRADLALHVMRLDLSFHTRHTPGALLERIDGDVAALANFFSAFVIQLAGSVLLLVGVIAVLSVEQWQAGLAFAGFVLVALLVLGRVNTRAAPFWQATRQASADLSGYLEERLAGTEDIRSTGATSYVLARLYPLLRTTLKVDRTANVVSALVISTSLILFALGAGVSLGLGAWLYRAGSISLGTVSMLFFYNGLITTPLREITDQLGDWQRAIASLGRIDELLRTTSGIRDGDRPLPDKPLALSFAGVTFGYNGEQDVTDDAPKVEGFLHLPPAPQPDDQEYHGSSPHSVLHDISFSLAPGETLGLLGRTGSGKTTIARLLLRLYDPQHGVIRLGDHDLRSIATGDLRRHIGVVTQEVQLFHASVRDNLSLFNRAIPDAHLLEALRLVGLAEWLDALPHGLDTLLDTGGGLSAGEAQLVALVRVFLKNPELVILDEASARLDPATERRIEHALSLLLRDRTAIIIAHRLTTVLRADAILILDEGRVAEFGPRAELQHTPTSRFATLLRVGLAVDLDAMPVSRKPQGIA